MDIGTLWEQVPPLLDACVCDDTAALSTLRLVSKEASQVALVALRSYTLVLKEGNNGCRSVSGANLLQHTRLQTLNVHLLLTDGFSPAILLQAFVREVGNALSKLTRLSLSLEDRFGSAATITELRRAITLLVGACPTLTTFSIKGPFHTGVMRSLEQLCPLLSTLIITCPEPVDQQYLTQLLLLLPSMLPNVTNLSLLGCTEDDYNLSGLPANISILSLELEGRCMQCDDDWLSLPPGLQHLKVFNIADGPPPTLADGRPVLGSLLTLEMAEEAEDLSLQAFAQILRAAPSFQRLNLPSLVGDRRCVINCLIQPSIINAAAAVADLVLLHRKIPSIHNFRFSIEVAQRTSLDGDLLLPVIAALPTMSGVTSCKLLRLAPGELSQMIKRFPDVQELELTRCNELDDVELQDLEACAHLRWLNICGSRKLTPMGLFVLCQRLPELREVVCLFCAQLGELALQGFESLLERYGLPIKVVFAHSEMS